MNEMSTFESIILGIMAIGLVYLFGRGTKAAMDSTPEAKPGDWMSAIKPLALVIAFVFLLILFAKN